MLLSGALFTSLPFLACNLLAGLPWAAAIRQIRHDSSFQPDYILRVTEETAALACRTRLSALINGTIPGPPIYLKENQTTWVRVCNDMIVNNFTMHWHGLTDSVSPWSDGTPQGSQWPIKAQHFFDYELHPAVGTAGTYFYHSHVDFQASTAAGPVIIEEADGTQPPYDYDEDRIFFLSELFNVTDATTKEWLDEHPLSWPGEAESILVNGKGYRSLPGTVVGTSTPYNKPNYTAEKPCGPEIIEVDPGKTYRFRSIGGVALSPLAFAIQDHTDLTVISIDGAYTQPASVDLIQMAGGQRYDYLLETKTTEELQQLGKSQFWIQIETRYRDLNDTFYAILKYNTDLPLNETIPSSPPTYKPGAPPSEKPIQIPYNLEYWMEYAFEPLTPNGFPSADQVTRQVILTAAQIKANDGVFWTINNRTWTEEDQHEGDTPIEDKALTGNKPYLVNIYLEGDKAIPDYETAVEKYGGYDPELNVYAAKVGEVIDIIIINQPNGYYGGFDAHPFHIHGGHIYDLGSGPGEYNATANEEKLQGYNPITRDTSLLFKYTNGQDDAPNSPLNYTNQGWRAWRLKVDNAGVWMLHCHNLFHMVMGMQSLWVMGNATEITRDAEPVLVEGYLTFGGDAYGNASYDPLVSHYFD